MRGIAYKHVALGRESAYGILKHVKTDEAGRKNPEFEVVHVDWTWKLSLIFLKMDTQKYIIIYPYIVHASDICVFLWPDFQLFVAGAACLGRIGLAWEAQPQLLPRL